MDKNKKTLHEWAVFRMVNGVLHWYGLFVAERPQDAVRLAKDKWYALPEYLWETARAAGHVMGYAPPEKEWVDAIQYNDWLPDTDHPHSDLWAWIPVDLGVVS